MYNPTIWFSLKFIFFYSNDETNGIRERLSRISKQDYRKRIQEHAKLFLRERRETTRERDERLRDALLYEWRSYIYVLLLPMSILKNCWPLLLYTKHLTLYENTFLTIKFGKYIFENKKTSIFFQNFFKCWAVIALCKADSSFWEMGLSENGDFP